MYTKEEIYAIMFTFLSELYEKSKSDTIGSLLGDMCILDDTTVDPAILEDWNKIIKQENFDNLMDAKQSVLIIKKFLELYRDNFEMDLDEAILELDRMLQNEKYIKEYMKKALNTSEICKRVKFSLNN